MGDQVGEEDLDAELVRLCEADEYHPARIRELLARGADPNARQAGGWKRECALSCVIQRRNPDVEPELVEAFLDAKADPNFTDEQGERSPLMAAASYGLARVCQVLLSRGATFESAPGALHATIVDTSWHRDTMKVLLDAGADPNSSYQGDTPATSATISRDREALQILISRGADLNAHAPCVDFFGGATPLTAAAGAHRDASITRYLLDEGADPNLRDGAGNLPLHRAVWSGCQELIELLLKRGADIDGLDAAGATPLCRYVAWGHADSARVAYLLDLGADHSIPDAEGNSPLHHAVKQSLGEIVEVLVESGADAGIENHSGESPRSIAAAMGKEMLLVRMGAERVALDMTRPIDLILDTIEQGIDWEYDGVALTHRGERLYYTSAPGTARIQIARERARELLAKAFLDGGGGCEHATALLNASLASAGQARVSVEDVLDSLKDEDRDLLERARLPVSPHDAAHVVCAHLFGGGSLSRSDKEGMEDWRFVSDEDVVRHRVQSYNFDESKDYTREELLAHWRMYFTMGEGRLNQSADARRFLQRALQAQGFETLRQWALGEVR